MIGISCIVGPNLTDEWILTIRSFYKETFFKGFIEGIIITIWSVGDTGVKYRNILSVVSVKSIGNEIRKAIVSILIISKISVVFKIIDVRPEYVQW
jgi:hypothetical protein